MSRVVLAALLLLGCARTWVPPQVEVLHPGDRRVCGPDHRCVDLIDTSESSSDLVAGSEGFFEVIFGPFGDPRPRSELWTGLDGIASALDRLDPGGVGVALIGFAGYIDAPAGADRESWVEIGITDDYPAVRTALERVRARGASGMSCHACAVKLAGALLRRPSDGNRCEAVVMVGDTIPTQPYGPGNMDANEWELAGAVAATNTGTFTLISLGSPDDALTLKEKLSPERSRVIFVRDAAQVADAIAKAVDACA